MSPELPPLHEDLTFHGPLSAVRADRLAGFAAGVGSGRVVDIGCGWAELLLRTVARGPALTGLGIDRDAGDILHGRALAEVRACRTGSPWSSATPPSRPRPTPMR
jgi:hypothetical protein